MYLIIIIIKLLYEYKELKLRLFLKLFSKSLKNNFKQHKPCKHHLMLPTILYWVPLSYFGLKEPT